MTPRTTRCCSAVALTLACAACATAANQKAQPFPAPARAAAKAKLDRTPPLSLFPLRTLWTLELYTPMTAPEPAFDGVHAFFPIDENRVVAYDLSTGSQMWIASIGTSIRPVASPDLLFVAEARAIVALRVADGTVAWQLPFAQPLAAPLAWDNGWLVAAAADGSVSAFRGIDGHLVWRATVGSPAHAPPSLAADRVYVPTEDGRVVALRVETGEKIWEYRLGGAASEILALDDRLYVGSKDNDFYCLKAPKGEEDWIWHTGADVIGLPVADEHNVYFLSLDNVLRALNRRSGNQQWKRPLSVRPTAGPVKAGDVLIVPGLALSLPAFAVADGNPAGDINQTSEIAAPPHVVTLPGVYGPVIVIITRDIAKGATVIAWARDIEPATNAVVPLLPNPVTFTPVGTPPTSDR